MSDSDKRKRGMETFEKVMRFAPPDPTGDSFLEVTVDHLFADVWSEPGLSIRERRLVTLTVLAGLGNESVLKIHAGAAIDREIDDYTWWIVTDSVAETVGIENVFIANARDQIARLESGGCGWCACTDG